MASRKWVVDLDLKQNEIQNPVIQNLASAPSTPKEGQPYWNTTNHRLNIYNGSTWLDATKSYTFSTGLTESNETVTLNAATTSALGGVIVGSNISVSSGTISVADASTSAKGVIEIATDTEASTGTATTLAVNPKQLATKVTANGAITAATRCKITYDAKGLVTGGADLVENDIPSLHLSKITDVSATAAEVNVLDGITATTAELNIMDGVTATATEINILDGVTASTSEINVLHGITATTAELNYCDGVTSNIQTQIDNKVTKNSNITAATKCKVTYDAKGLVTAGADLTTSDIPDLSATYVPQTAIGAANGVAGLDGDGKVPTSQLPSYVDDVVDAYIVSGATALSSGWLSATSGGSALTPETGKIYVVLTTGEYLNKTYRWSGTTYVEISAAPAQATESTAGIAAIATQAEVTTGTNDTKFVTPLKLATHISGMTKKFAVQNSALTATGGVCTWSITNSLGTRDVGVHVYEVSSGDEVTTSVTATSGTITVKINSASNIAANTYRAVVIG